MAPRSSHLEPILVQSMEEACHVLARKVEQQENSLVPELVHASVICSPDFLFNIGELYAARASNQSSATSSSKAAAPAIDPQLVSDVITAANVFESLKEADAWREMSKHVTEDIVRNVGLADGRKYLYRNRDQLSVRHGVRLNYVCVDSLQNKNRIKATGKRRTKVTKEDGSIAYKKLRVKKVGDGALPVCDCKGYVNVDFDHANKEIRITYRHLLVHPRHPVTDTDEALALDTTEVNDDQADPPKTTDGARKSKTRGKNYSTSITPAMMASTSNGAELDTTNPDVDGLKFDNVPHPSVMAKDSPKPPQVYTCALCGKNLSRQEHLKRHIQSVHTANKPYSCKHCHRTFSRYDNMKQHLVYRPDTCRRVGRQIVAATANAM